MTLSHEVKLSYILRDSLINLIKVLFISTPSHAGVLYLSPLFSFIFLNVSCTPQQFSLIKFF